MSDNWKILLSGPTLGRAAAVFALSMGLLATTACTDDNDEGDTGGELCGDGTCSDGEDNASCPDDCDAPDPNPTPMPNPDPMPECGNGTCDDGEDDISCPEDCVEDCFVDEDCGAGEICEGEACIEGCREDGDCGGNELCIDNACGTAGEVCREDADCNDGFLCDEANNICIEDEGQCIPDGNEPNDNTGEGADVGNGDFENLTICGIDNDYYQYTLAVGDQLSATISFEGDLDFQIVDAGSQPVAEATTVDGGLAVNFTATEEGDFFLRVFGEGDTAELNVEYTLTANVTLANDLCDADDSEPNNDPNSATLLTPAGLTDRTACVGDDDFYSFSLLAGETGAVTIDFDNAEGDLTLVLFDGDTEVDRSEGGGDSETVRFTSTDGGTYTAQVITNKVDGGSSYGIGLTVTEPTGCVPDDFEPNNDRASAAEAPLGETTGLVVCGNDRDFYAIELGPLDSLTIDLAFIDDNGDIDITLRGPNDEFIDGSSGVGNTEQVEALDALPGTYVLEVRVLGGDDVSNTYDMTYTVVEGPEPPECADDNEPNNDADNATVLAGEPIISQDNTICADDPDFFSITTTEDNTRIGVTATTETFFGTYTVTILDTDGTTVIDTVTSLEDPITAGGVAPVAGTYFISVENNTGEATPYDLEVTLVSAPPCDDPFEPNENSGEATVIVDDAVDAAVACNDEVDVYELEILEPLTRMTIDATFANTFGDIDLEILDSDGMTVLETAETQGAGETIVFTFENTGIFFLRAQLGGGTNTPYNLSIDREIVLDCSDEFEPNNNTDEATDLPVGIITGVTLCDVDDEEDFWAITITEEMGETLIDITLNFEDDDGDIDVELLDTDGTTVIDSSRGVIDSENVSATVVPGTYFIRAFILSFGAQNTYSINYRVVEPAECIDANEPNDAAIEGVATNIALDPIEAVVCVGEEDFYAITVTEAPAEIRFNAAFNAAFGDIDLELLDLDGATSLDVSDNTGNNESINFTVETVGTYFVRAFLKDGGDNTGYVATSLVVGEIDCADEFEPNNSILEASQIPPGTYPALTVCRDPDQDEFDFFAIYLESGDEINILLNFVDADGDIDLQFIDTDGTSLISSSGGTDDDEEITETVEADGFYFIRVRLFTSGVRNFYQMAITAPERTPPVCVDDNLEPNNAPDEASLLGEGVVDRQICTGDADVYLVNLIEGDILTATLDFVHADGNLAIDLIDIDENVLASVDNSDDENSFEFLAFRAPTSADFFLRVRGGGLSENLYSLTSEVVDALPVEPCQDALEPNNTPGSAARIEPGEITDLDICDPQDLVDVYAIEIPAGSIAQVDVTFSRDVGADLDLQILDTDGETILVDVDNFGDNETAQIITGDTGGTFFISVAYSDFFDISNTYSLAVSVEELLCEDDGREPGDDSTLTAPLLEPGTYTGQICTGNTDFIQFIANEGDIVQALLSFTDVDGDLGLRLYDQDGATVLAEVNSTFSDTEALIFGIETAGLYFLEVFGSGQDFNSYSLDFGFADCGDEFDPNDDFDSASPIDPGTFEGLSLCTPDIDEFDFFAVDLEVGQTIDVLVTFVDAVGDIDLDFFGPDQALEESSGGVADSEDITFTAAVAGTHFIRVDLFTDEAITTYDMTVTVTDP